MHNYPIETRILIDGVPAYVDPEDLRDGRPTVLDGLSFTWGRSSSVDQPDVGTCSFTLRVQLVGDVVPMLDVIKVGATVEVWSDITIPGVDGDPDTIESVPVWAGAVSSAVGQAAGYVAVQIAVVASDPAAPLADETIGDDPWPVQNVRGRVDRILRLAQTDTTPITIDPGLTNTQLTYRDVDKQPALGLLQDIAQSVGAVLWVATDSNSGTYLWMEDPSRRAAVKQFLIDATTGKVVISGNNAETEMISAADLLRDPIQWEQNKAQVINSVDVSWEDQGTDDNGLPTTTTRTITVTDGEPKIIRKLSIATELISKLDASSLASRMLSLVGGTNGWIASGVSIDTTLLKRDIPELAYVQRVETIRDLLDATKRLGRAVTLIDLPAWSPNGETASVYIEGGTYTLDNGRWLLDLNISAPTGLGRSATFADFNDTGIRVSDFDPTIKIRDAWGVAGPEAVTAGMGTGQFGNQAFGR